MLWIFLALLEREACAIYGGFLGGKFLASFTIDICLNCYNTGRSFVPTQVVSAINQVIDIYPKLVVLVVDLGRDLT